jgi:cytochrome c-type biogenesis protein
MGEPARTWYVWLGGLNAAATGPLDALADAAGVPLLSALLFGVMGSTSPCQLTTNASALAYVLRAGGRGRATAVFAYLVGKALVYTLVGGAVVLLGQGLAQSSIPVVVVARKVLGPLMVLLGLHALGVVRLRVSVGRGLADRIEARAGPGAPGALVLGASFGFAFCPTLFLLFFGLTIPLALGSPAGAVYPAVFALGTTLPLLAVVGLLASGRRAAAAWAPTAGHAGRLLAPMAGLVLLAAGLGDTFTYWFL